MKKITLSEKQEMFNVIKELKQLIFSGCEYHEFKRDIEKFANKLPQTRIAYTCFRDEVYFITHTPHVSETRKRLSEAHKRMLSAYKNLICEEWDIEQDILLEVIHV